MATCAGCAAELHAYARFSPACGTAVDDTLAVIVMMAVTASYTALAGRPLLSEALFEL